jgi:hypothetical protein
MNTKNPISLTERRGFLLCQSRFDLIMVDFK